MSVYHRARRHALLMGWALLGTIGFVVASDLVFGHSVIAFTIAVAALVVLNLPILRFNCPRCGTNLFFRGVVLLPWPRRTCGKCGLALDREPPPGQ
jgi:ribosomal protein S27AE